jgi:hypothetical protein
MASVRSPGPAALYVARPLPEGRRIVLRALCRSLHLLVLCGRLSLSHAPMLYPSEPSRKPLEAILAGPRDEYAGRV